MLIVSTSVESADVALCVLSSPEVVSNSKGIQYPPALAPLIKDDTFILYNKTDLLAPSTPPPNAQFQKHWLVSLETGQGVQAFMDGFGAALQKK